MYPVHLNPNVRDIAYEELNDVERIYLMDPLNYREFSLLMKNSYLIITDSGGIQEEAPALGKPVLVVRDNTERWEAVEAGTVKLIGSNMTALIDETHKLLTTKEYYDNMAKARNPYGDGEAARRVIEYLNYFFKIADSKPDEFSEKNNMN